MHTRAQRVGIIVGPAGNLEDCKMRWISEIAKMLPVVGHHCRLAEDRFDAEGACCWETHATGINILSPLSAQGWLSSAC